jgi:flavin reductase (DIM6/NTAB) family NADH-FMN oxidoreductase RutF
MLVAVIHMLSYHMHEEAAARGPHSPDQRPNRFSVLRVSMVRIELCSTRTIGRSARRGILCGVCGVSMLEEVGVVTGSFRLRR